MTDRQEEPATDRPRMTDHWYADRLPSVDELARAPHVYDPLGYFSPESPDDCDTCGGNHLP